MSDEQQDAGFSLKKGSGKNMPVSLTLEHVSPVTRLLEKKQEMLRVQESLDKQKEDYQRKEELFRRREESLRKKDLELQEALVLFNKFLKENEHKRNRADHRAKEEVKRRVQSEEDIVIQKRKLEELKLKLEKLKRKATKNNRYMEFLSDCVQNEQSSESQYDGPQPLISRQVTLNEAYEELKKKQLEKTAETEKTQEQLKSFKKEQYNHSLILNNKSTEYSATLQVQKAETQFLTEKVISKEKKEESCMQATYQMILNIENLYNRCINAPGGIKHTAKEILPKDKEGKSKFELRKMDIETKLDTIADYLEDFQWIVEKTASSYLDVSKKSNQRSKASQFYSEHRNKETKKPPRAPKQKTKRQLEKEAKKAKQRAMQESMRQRQRNPNESQTSNAGMASVSSTDMSNMTGSFNNQ